MKVAIIGSGFSGLAVCWNLLQQVEFNNSIKITVMDPLGIGGGTSGLAAGLLHPYTGAHGKLNWKGLEGFEATAKLLAISSDALGKPVVSYSGILRLATTDSQKTDFLKTANIYSDVVWLDNDECKRLLPGVTDCGGLLIKEGAVVDCSLYLQGLWLACEKLGAVFEKRLVGNLQELNDFQLLIVATGATIKDFPEFSFLPITKVKGQVLELEWPKNLDPIPLPLNSQKYLVMQNMGLTCIAGATYEKNFNDHEPDRTVAQLDILPKIEAIFPAFKNVKVIDCKAGLRASTPTHHPLIGKLNDRCWYITGMGSKGLLYHALFAKQLVDQISGGLERTFGGKL